MEDRDAFHSFFKDAEAIFRTLSELEQALLGDRPQPSHPTQCGTQRKHKSPREQVLSNEYLAEENNEPIDLSQVPGSKSKVYSDLSSTSTSEDRQPTFPGAFGGQSFGLRAFSSTSITQQYNSATGTSDTIVQQSHHRNGQDYTCTQRFWQAVDGTRQQEGECHDSQGRRLERSVEDELLVCF
jgi:hypothetical protein